MFEAIIVLVVLGLAGFFIIKKYHPALVLIIGAILLLGISVLLGNPLFAEGEGTGLAFFDIFLMLRNTIVSQVGGAGLVIMILFGYSAYMSHIGANQIAVNILVRPMTKIKSKALFIPIVFLLGNLMSLVVPSASALAIILMAILYPLLKGIGISSMTAAGVIAMTATIMPTPLGADNVVAAETLGINILTYVGQHAMISIPTLLVLAVVQLIWQRYCDKKEGAAAFVEIKTDTKEEEKTDVPSFYALFPLLPLILILGVGIASIISDDISMDIFILTIISFFITLIVETIRKKSFRNAQESALELFKGMGQGFSQVVVLVVGGSLFTSGIQSLGVVNSIMTAVENAEAAGVLTTMIFSGATAIFGILSGGGLAMFYATIELIPEIAARAGIYGNMITLPMQMIANLSRTVSPVAAVIMIVSSSVGVSPMKLLKRTAVPTLFGMIMVMILAMVILH